MKKIIQLTLIFTLLLFAKPAFAAFTLLDHASNYNGNGGGNLVTINSTGADLLVIVVSGYTSSVGLYDSFGNTYTQALAVDDNVTPNHLRIFYAIPTADKTGTNHSIRDNNSGNYSSYYFAAFNGVSPTSPLDSSTSQNFDPGVTVSPGSITPTIDNELVISASGGRNGTTPPSVGGVTLLNAESNHGSFAWAGGMGYQIQTTATAVNPNWTFNGSGVVAATIAFKPNISAYATAYTLTPPSPSSGNVNSASADFTVTPIGGTYTGTITPSDGGADGTFTPVSLSFSGTSAAQTFTYTPATAGSKIISVSAYPTLGTDPTGQTYTANATVPNAPTGVSATAGNAQATVTFLAPDSNGGATIDGYTVTSIPSGGTDSNAGTVHSYSHIVTGLTNGTPYTFTVTAHNSAGTSTASAASNSVTPSAPATTKAITAFDFASPAVTGTINETNHTAALTVPFGTDVTALVPTITQNGSSIVPNTGVAQNFTSSVNYTVTAANNSTQVYIVTVTIAAAIAPVTFGTDTTLALTTPAINLTVLSGSVADSVTVNAGNIVVTISSSYGGSFRLTSPQAMTVDTGTISQSCSSGIQTETITQVSGTTAYTLTPTGSACVDNTAKAITASSVGGSGPISGSMGGHRQDITNLLATTISLTSLQDQIITLTVQLNSLLALRDSQTLTIYNFTRNLSIHATGEDVRSLQKFLNTNGFVIATTGAGSPGNETTFFGSLTYKALMKFQASVGLPASGYFGPMTREYIAKNFK